VFVFTVVLLAGALLSGGCGTPPEQQLLQKYFQASRMRDNATLANIATVSFSPTEHGSVQSFDIINPGVEERRPLRIKELAAAEDAARQADEEFNKKKKEYQDANLTAIERVLKGERSSATLRGADAEVQKAWTQWREEAAEHSKKLSDARKALGAERSLAEVSVFDARNPVDATKFDGELIEKTLAIKARVRSQEGTTADRDLTIRLMRAELTNGPEGKAVSGRWIVTQITEGADAAPPTN
jgi:hypothetical protein